MNIITFLKLMRDSKVQVKVECHNSNMEENKQGVVFKQNTANDCFYFIPDYSISSSGNVNLTFMIDGEAKDWIHNKTYERAKRFKCINIVKDFKLHTKTLQIAQSNIQLIKDKQIIISDDGVIDLSQFELKLDYPTESDDKFAKEIIKQYLYDVYRHKAVRAKSEPRSEESEWLYENGFDDRSNVWRYINSTPTKAEKCSITWSVENRKTVPSFDKIIEKFQANKKLTDLESKLVKFKQKLTLEEHFELQDNKSELNHIKYALLSKNIAHAFETDVEILGETFHVAVTL